MNGPYHVRALTSEDVLRAYTVVHTVRPDITLDEWRDHIDEVLNSPTASSGEQGAHVLVGPNDYFYGLYTYRIRRNLGFGRTLDVDDFCVVPLTSRRSASGALLGAAEELARQSGCRAVSLTFLDDEIWQRPTPPHESLKLEGSFVASPPGVMKLID